MDHVTLVMPLSGTIGRPRANNWYSLQAHKIWRYLTLAVPKIFHRVWNSKIGHVTMTTPTFGTVGHQKVVLLVAKPCTKFEVCSFNRSEGISWDVKF